VTKTVCLPLRVPSHPFCWEYVSPIVDGRGEICEYFDNEGGHPTCQLKLGSLWDNRTKDGIRKPKECLALVEIR